MGRFIASWGFRGSVSSFPLHLPLLSSFFTLSLSFSLQLSPKNSIGTFCQPLYCTAAACSDHCTFLGNCPPTPPPNQYQNLLLRQGKMLAQGRSRWPVSQKRIMIRLFQVLRQWGSRKSKRHAKSWRRGRRCLFFSCSFSFQRTRLSRSLEQATCCNLVSSRGGGTRPIFGYR